MFIGVILDTLDNIKQTFSLFFDNSVCGELEFRVFYYCCAEVTHWETIVRPLDEGLMGKFWNKTNQFQFVTGTTFPTPGKPGTAMMNTGNQILIVDGIWYIFYREFDYGPTPPQCSQIISPISRTVVRQSTDWGRTWSNEYPVATPIPNTGSECAVLDGSAFYDEDTNTWHYLGQCIGATGGWSMCHYSLQGKVPYSSNGFVPNPKNPVVRGGQLFSQICAGTGKHCQVGMVDEGTPDIVEKQNGYFYVTFHGFDYNRDKSGRGVAKTRDFVNWEVIGFRLPDDIIFSSVDCHSWNVEWANGECVGGGEGSILKSGDYYYQLIEAPDISLACITQEGKQNWVLGLLRAPVYYASGQWQQFQNPTIVPWEKYGCALQYHRIFSDGLNVFLSFYIIDFPKNTLQLQIFVMVSGEPKIPMIATPP